MAVVYIPESAKYSEVIANNLWDVANKLEEIIELCSKIRDPLYVATTGADWYHYRYEFRKIYDSIATLEHDAYLAALYITEIEQKNWDLYYKEHPDEVPT